ncbi:nuclear receptor coactivator 2 [Leptidea sinapis]|uniref:nuclear receptor coactivator 2 n=1 Tax=Leptidea sinapis TaxID=189913 RepID=UPI0021C2E7AD|nr:nuclear receptor coactivator 2 [Leptidea sinapis]
MLPMVQAALFLSDAGNHSTDGVPQSAHLTPPTTSDSDVEELVDIFFDIDVAVVKTLSRIESCDLQLGDTWRGMQSKMSVTAPVKKIRKKSENKPQSQINKCHNEKKRRELENEVINQLEELLGACLADVKQPDKNGIVREATRQLQEALNRRRDCPAECPVRRGPCLSPVQGGEVSSTQHSASHDFHFSDISTLIEAVKHYTSVLGLILMEINSRGDIECVTENIKDFILFERTELYKKSLFSLLHPDDHAKFNPLLRTVQTFAWGAADSEKFQNIQARFRIKDIDVADGTRV